VRLLFTLNYAMLANVALPAFFPHSIATLVGIFILAAIEGWFLKRRLKLDYRSAFWESAAANWKSTLVGIPFAWLLFLIGGIPLSMGISALPGETHPLTSATLAHTMLYGGMIPTVWSPLGQALASLIMLIPYYFGSVWIECRTLRKRLPDHDPNEISKAVIRGNLTTYAIFLVVAVNSLVIAINILPESRESFEQIEKQRQERRERNYQEEMDVTRKAP
jgi:hypothetical protein